MLSFKAGRAFRRGDSNWVDPGPTKGLISIELSSEDGLLHFMWKNRETGQTEEDLIIFQGEATFEKVQSVPTGRVYVLKFSSSDQRFFFWMQNADSSQDEWCARSVNAFFDDPSFIPTNPPAPAPRSQSATEQFASLPVGGPPSLNPPSTEEQLRQLQQLVQTAAAAVPGTYHGPDLSLEDVITPQTLEPLFNRPDLLQAIFPNLPTDLPAERNAETLRQVIQSSAFKASLRGLQQALNTGLISNLVISLGLPPEAGTGVGPFLRAIAEQARGIPPGFRGHGEDERMETD